MFLYDDDALSTGALIGGWVIERLVARGSMSNVYLATGGLEVHAALKVLHKTHLHDRVALERRALEARALGSVAHPGVVRCLDKGELPSGLPYLALEWLEGETLAQRVAKDGPLPLAEATGVLEALCAVVAATHAAGLVHRDLKAENVFCLSGGGIKLLDFGVARQLEARGTALTSTGHVIGTPIALAPEQLRGGPTSEATDVYALGVLVHVMLAGRPPFEGEALLDLEELHLHAAPPPLSARAAVPPALDAVVQRCLEKEPAARHAGAPQLWQAWQAALDRPADTLAVGLSVRLEPDGDDGWGALERLEREAAVRLARSGFELASEAVLVFGTRLEHGEPGEVERRWRAFAAGLKRELGAPGVRVQAAVRVAAARVEGGSLVDSEALHPLEWPPDAGVE